MPPFMVLKRKSAASPRTNVSSTLPLMVPKSDFSRGFSVKVTFTGPLTVRACPEPATSSISMLPFTLWTEKFPFTFFTVTMPAVASVIAMAAKRPIHIELEQIGLFGNVELDLLLRCLHPLFRFGADGFIYYELHLVTLASDHLNRAEYVVNLENLVRRSQGKRLADGFLVAKHHSGVVIVTLDRSIGARRFGIGTPYQQA